MLSVTLSTRPAAITPASYQIMADVYVLWLAALTGMIDEEYRVSLQFFETVVVTLQSITNDSFRQLLKKMIVYIARVISTVSRCFYITRERDSSTREDDRDIRGHGPA